MSTIEEWKVIAEYHKRQLTNAEKNIQEMSGSVAPAPMSYVDMEARVLELASKKQMKAWKKVVLEENLIDNVVQILDKSYDMFFDPDSVGNEVAAKAKNVLGTHNSLKWQLFVLDVIKHLFKAGSFSNEDGGFDCFEDTAGGCDETTWDAGCYIIETSETTLS